MKFDDLKDQLKDQWNETWGRVQESPTYNTLREKYETLPSNAQTGIKVGIGLVVFLLLVHFPYSFYSSSKMYESEYNDSQGLIRKLLRASRQAAESSNIPPALTATQVVERVQGDLASQTLLPEQIEAVTIANAAEFGTSLAPAKIKQEGVAVRLKQLNLRQIVDIGYQLQGLNPSVKLVGTDITANAADPHYYDVVYKLASYSLGLSAGDASAGARPRGKAGSSAQKERARGQPPKASRSNDDPASGLDAEESENESFQ